MIVAVEPSADHLGAALARALRARLGSQLRLVGVGGPALAAEGLNSPFDPSALAVIGVFNALAAYPEVRRRVRQTAALAAAERPHAAILIDAWGFNLRVAHALRRLDPAITLIKYVAPQVWATRPGRARTLARAVDRLLTIHSFDPPYFEREGLPTTFVGNPALNREGLRSGRRESALAPGITGNTARLLLLPGSRAGEVDRLMPVFKATVERLVAARPDLSIVVAPSEAVAERVKSQLAHWPRRPDVVEGEAARLEAMLSATVALVCSGTVTTELALAGCPMVVTYRLGPLTHVIAKRLIRTPFITLLNVAAGRFVAPERVQDQCTAEILSADLGRLLDDANARREQVAAQTAAIGLMRGGIDSPVEAAADAIVDMLRNR